MAGALANYPVIIDSQGEETNPTTSVVLADTGEITNGGIYESVITVAASAAMKVSVQRRNAANDANVGDVRTFYVLAGDTFDICLRTEIEVGERIRVIPFANLTGTAIATITTSRVA